MSFNNDTPLKNSPWKVSGAFTMPAMRDVTVNTVGELVEEIMKQMELSPTSKVSIQATEDLVPPRMQ